MILSCWRPPRSAGSTPAGGRSPSCPTARFSTSALSAIDAAARTATSIVDSSPRPAWTAASRSRKIQASAVCSRSNSLTWMSPWRAVDCQWIRFKVSPGAHGRTVVASGVVWRVRSGDAWLPSTLAGGQPPERQRLDPRVDDDVTALADRRRRLEEPERVAGPDLERLDPEVAAPGQRRPDQPRPLAGGRRATARGRAGRRAASSGCGPRATASGAGRCCAACT